MKIPVFVSCPTILNKRQADSRQFIIEQLEALNVEPRSLGQSDYPKGLPLREVLAIARHCSGGVILGFSVFEAQSGVWWKGTNNEKKTHGSVLFPTPWNNLEAGILFGLGLPILIFREEGLAGGVFDNGVTDVFVHRMPTGSTSDSHGIGLKDVFLRWHAAVSTHYYRRLNIEPNSVSVT